MALALYMDVHVPAPIPRQLRVRGVDLLTAQEDSTTTLPDDELLIRAGEPQPVTDIIETERMGQLHEDHGRHVAEDTEGPRPGLDSVLARRRVDNGVRNVLEELPQHVDMMAGWLGGWRMADGGWRMADGGWRMADGGWIDLVGITTPHQPVSSVQPAHYPFTSNSSSRQSCGMPVKANERSQVVTLTITND